MSHPQKGNGEIWYLKCWVFTIVCLHNPNQWCTIPNYVWFRFWFQVKSKVWFQLRFWFQPKILGSDSNSRAEITDSDSDSDSRAEITDSYSDSISDSILSLYSWFWFRFQQKMESFQNRFWFRNQNRASPVLISTQSALPGENTFILGILYWLQPRPLKDAAVSTAHANWKPIKTAPSWLSAKAPWSQSPRQILKTGNGHSLLQTWNHTGGRAQTNIHTGGWTLPSALSHCHHAPTPSKPFLSRGRKGM